jgi:ribosomal protein S18 acetylase RimI-like enzyme
VHSDPSFRLASAADAPVLSPFAKQIFLDTFGPDNDPADITAYVDTAFSTVVQAAEIAAPDTFTLLAETAGGALAGYAYVAFGTPPTTPVGPDAIEIKRFYVAREHHGRGVANALMREVLDRARALGARTIWLGVWERNARAIAFYQRHGFKQIGTHPFLLGGDLQRDWEMQRAL